MSAILTPARQWWDGRSRREQGLLAVMIVILLGVVLWLLVVRPAWRWRDAAADRRVEAVADRARVEAGVRLLAASASTPAAVTSPAGIQPVIIQTAEDAGLEVATAMDTTGTLGFRAARVSSAALFGWLAELRSAHGIETTRLAVVENADATLAVEGAFATAAGDGG
tara:strand:+ start:2275 stop:2775 length:501 start_codon:yes stop_codon:yes gene_type:complete